MDLMVDIFVFKIIPSKYDRAVIWKCFFGNKKCNKNVDICIIDKEKYKVLTYSVTILYSNTIITD